MAVTSKGPRISVNDLALFMVSSDTARMGIIRRAKFPQKSVVIRYRDARPPLVAHLTDPIRSVNPLATAEQMLAQRAIDPSQSSLAQDDAKQSIEVLHAIQGMANKLKGYDFQSVPLKQAKLKLGGVEVSVYADMLVHGSTKGHEQIGAAILRMTQDDADTDPAKAKRKEMGLYVATMARLHVDQNISSNRQPTNKLCMSIDVQHGEVFCAPDSNTRRMKDLENACRTIAALWPTIEK
ncbi:hypothetical protein [Taklimakanibacter albus]|uniref:Uncharacterized protein n=1 Tax=Taklimakanibacter albus TaxID=2800327 RepID=A0ACC5R5Z7_9HYPH|nr:hypothetical protein [Aestuariivirga sp. YIM B02566]MBK1868091.1 hypothetical protein [Aestuariivirga sp. YIM B02566]